MKITLKKDKNYTIHEIYESTWLRVEKNNKLIAQVMNIETARQVIYRDINDNGGKCEYLHDEDFE